MGYRPERKTITLKFVEPYDGLEVKVSSLSFGQMLDLGDEMDRLKAGAGLAGIRNLVETFASKITHWNLENDLGEIEPITLGALLAQESDLVMAAIKAWEHAMVGVDAELGKDSTSGRQSAPPNFPMEAL